MQNAQPAEKAPGFPAAARMIVSGRGERRRRPRVFPPKVCFLSAGWRRDAACAAVSPCTQRNSFSPLPLFVRPTDAPCPGRGEDDPAQDRGTSPPHGNGIPAGEPCGKTGGVKSAGYRKSRVPGGWPGAGAVLRRGRPPQGPSRRGKPPGTALRARRGVGLGMDGKRGSAGRSRGGTIRGGRAHGSGSRRARRRVGGRRCGSRCPLLGKGGRKCGCPGGGTSYRGEKPEQRRAETPGTGPKGGAAAALLAPKRPAERLRASAKGAGSADGKARRNPAGRPATPPAAAGVRRRRGRPRGRGPR